MGSAGQDRVVGNVRTNRPPVATPLMGDTDAEKQVRVMVCLVESLYGT